MSKYNAITNEDDCDLAEIEEYCTQVQNCSRPVPGIIHNCDKTKMMSILKIKRAWEDILEALDESYGLNTNNPNFYDTPLRIAKMMVLERCSGINSEQDCIKLLKETKFPTMSPLGEDESDQLIVTTNPVIAYGICPHHFENVRYKVWTAYIPDKYFVGISKFSRMVDLYSKQPILQESFTINLANIMMKGISPKGAAVVVKGWHDCMICRGARSNPEQCMITSSIKGSFANPGNETFKEEFFRLCQNTGL